MASRTTSCRTTSCHTTSRRHADTGGTTVEFALLLPLLLAVIGLAVLSGWATITLSLLDRAAEVAARELAIDGDLARATAEARDATPLVTVDDVEVRDAAGNPVVGRPRPGQSFTATATTRWVNVAAPLVRALPGSLGMPDALTLGRTAEGVGQ